MELSTNLGLSVCLYMSRVLRIYIKNFKVGLEVAAEEKEEEQEKKENNKKTMSLLNTSLPWPRDHKSM